jgi:hypothetical protein
MAGSQNGFNSYKLSIHRKTNIMQIMTKNIKIFIFLIFYHKEIVKLDHFMKFFLELCKHSSVMQPLQNPPFCSSTVSIVNRARFFKLFKEPKNHRFQGTNSARLCA